MTFSHKLTSKQRWASPPIERDVYRVEDLRPYIPVLFLMAGGSYLLGRKEEDKRKREPTRYTLYNPTERKFKEPVRGFEPEAWRPGRDGYPGELPNPITRQRDVSWRSPPVPPPPPKPESLDVSVLRYSEPPDITEFEAMNRMLRAIRTERVRPGREDELGLRGSQGMNALAEWGMAGEQARKDEYAATAADIWEPTPRDVTDAELCMAWFARLNPPEFTARYGETVYLNLGPLDRKPNRYQAVIVWRAIDPPVSWKRVGDALGVHEDTAKKYFKDARDLLCEIANCKKLPELWRRLGLFPKDQLAGVRERNRVHKLRG
jgi:hypothetical protein